MSLPKSLKESSQPNGFSLAKVDLRTPQDVVTLSRRTRAAGEEFGLPSRTIRNLSAATYETARLLMSVRTADAEVRLADGPSLQVVLRVPHADAPLAALHARLAEAVAPLRSMVDEVEITENGTELSVCLRVLFPVGAAARSRPSTRRRTRRPTARAEDEAPDELREQHGQLTRAFRELQSELQETNRGVVALHAELEANADKLRQAEDRLRLLLDSVQDYAICMLTPQGEIASWKSGAERLFAYAADEIIGRQLLLLLLAAERDLELPAEHLRLAEQRGKHAGECLRLRRGGAAFDAHVILTAVRRGRERELQGFSLVVRDITERKRLEEDLRRRAEDSLRCQPCEGGFPRHAVARAADAAQRHARLDASAADGKARCRRR